MSVTDGRGQEEQWVYKPRWISTRSSGKRREVNKLCIPASKSSLNMSLLSMPVLTNATYKRLGVDDTSLSLRRGKEITRKAKHDASAKKTRHKRLVRLLHKLSSLEPLNLESYLLVIAAWQNLLQDSRKICLISHDRMSPILANRGRRGLAGYWLRSEETFFCFDLSKPWLKYADH